jgi:ABC-type transport system involved in cytochrome c biogenesis permease component
MNARTSIRLIIYSLLLLTFCLGVPTLHYSVAIMVAVLVKHKDNPQALFEPIF